jgi:hypothetical protein
LDNTEDNFSNAIGLEESERLTHISLNPWLYDSTLENIEVIQYKLSGKCHVCGFPARYHRDDCEYSYPQLYIASIIKDNARGGTNETNR